MSMLRFGSAVLANPSVNLQGWSKTVCCSKGKSPCGSCGAGCKVKVASTVFAKYNPSKYLLSHCTIIAAVKTEPIGDKEGYLIKPEYDQFVNNNGDAWTTNVLKNSYKTFIGGHNFQEHVQIEELSKGRIIDAVLREIVIGKDSEGNDQTTLYVDILVATDRKHKDLVSSIESGNTSKLSMGCVIKHSRCTQCGKTAKDESEACKHVRYMKGTTFMDNNGVKRIVAELCGSEDEPESVKFIEASWVANPAFTGAVIRNIINPPEDIIQKIEHANQVESHVVKEGEYLKAANKKNAQDPPVEDTPPTEAPTEEDPTNPPADAPAEDTPPADEGAMPPKGAPMEPPEEEETDIKKLKDMIKKQVFKEISDEISQEVSETGEPGKPPELETLDENMVKPAHTLKKLWSAKKSWDSFLMKTSGNLQKEDFNKLRCGTYTLLTNNDPTILSRQGYKQRDVMAVLSYLDRVAFTNPLPIEIKKAMANLKKIEGLKPEELLRDVVTSIGRKLSKKEAGKVLSWLKILSYSRE